MPIQLHDKTYWTVAERLRLANKEVDPPIGIQSIDTELIQVGHITAVRASIAFADGRRFSGHAAVNADSRQPAERDAPVETAETSAVGRALAMAGFHGSPEGLAGAEEIMIAQARQAARSQGSGGDHGSRDYPSGSAAPRPASTPTGVVTTSGATPAQGRYLKQLWERAGREGPAPDAEQMSRAMASKLIDELAAEAQERGR